MKIILRNFRFIYPGKKVNNEKTDLLLLDGKISKITPGLKESDIDKEIDLEGKFLAPGFIDMHVHLREPGREDEETVATGCDSAAAGGFTGVACMPNTEPAIDSAEVITLIKKAAKSHIVDVYPVAAATVGRKGELISPMAELYEAGAVAFSDDGVAIKTSAMLRRALEYATMYNLTVIEHCEDDSLAGGSMNEGLNSTRLGLPPSASVSEDLIVMRDILMAEYTGANLHIAHISTAKAVQMVREAKAKGIKVTAEATPHHFTLTDDAVKTYDTNTKMNPPLRTQKDLEAVLKGLQDGTIDCIVSDHAPHAIEEKEAEYEFAPNGIIGLETEVGLAFSELYHKKVLSLEQLVEKFALNPRKILNIPPPALDPGSMAEFTILDPDEVWTVDSAKFKSKSVNTPFNRRLLTGSAPGIINKGKIYFQGELI
jgi:dihydroorotase